MSSSLILTCIVRTLEEEERRKNLQNQANESAAKRAEEAKIRSDKLQQNLKTQKSVAGNSQASTSQGGGFTTG